MKKSIFFFAISLIGFNGFAQWNYDNQNLIYSTNKIVTIGASTTQGSYGGGTVLEVVTKTPNEGVGISLATTTKSLFLDCSTYGNLLYLPRNEKFKFSYAYDGAAHNVMNINPSTATSPTGSVSIGTELVPTGYKLAVGGKIIAEELKVQLQAQWPDYVFAKEYKLPTLAEVEKQIQEKGHLLNVPSAQEVKENGIEVGNMAKIQQEKIEELTLYIIEQYKTNQAQQSQIDAQGKEIEELKLLIEKLIKK